MEIVMTDPLSLLMIFMVVPGVVMVLAGVAVPFIPQNFRQIFMLAAIAVSALTLTAGPGVHWQYDLFGQSLILHRADNLTLPFGIVFHIAAAITVIYGWVYHKSMGASAGISYAGAAIAAVHAGDLISLFIWWELTAVTSVFLIFASGTERANAAAVRYLLVQVLSGVLLLSGAAFVWRETGTWAFDRMTLDGTGPWLIFMAFGIKAAFPLLNGWLQDAYPEATITGTVILSAFTTKMAIYAFARGFPGTDMLIWIGAVMAILPGIFALVENDLRRVLAYSLNNQLGFMIVAIGIGTPLAINGAVAHAFISVLYKALLFMAVGAVLLRVGTAKASELGGLYKAMPVTLGLMLVGCFSIAAMPLFSGFVAKAMIMKAAATPEYTYIYLALLAGSVATIIHTAIKIPYFTFFGGDQGHTTEDAPLPMMGGMILAALGCVAIGLYPALLIDILPYSAEVKIYYTDAILGQLQLITFTIIAFAMLVYSGYWTIKADFTLLNADWFYRVLAPRIITPLSKLFFSIGAGAFQGLSAGFKASLRFSSYVASHPLSGPVIPGPAAFVQAILLGMILAVIYVALG